MHLCRRGIWGRWQSAQVAAVDATHQYPTLWVKSLKRKQPLVKDVIAPAVWLGRRVMKYLDLAQTVYAAGVVGYVCGRVIVPS